MSAIRGNNTFGTSMSLPAGGLDAGLRLYADVLRNPSFPAAEVEREKRVSRMLIRRQAGNWQTEAMRNFREAMFLRHPYRRDRFGTQASIDRIDRAAVVAHHAEYCTPANGVLAVLGDLDLDAAERTVRAVFADWPGGPGVASDVPEEPPLTRSRLVTFPTSKAQVVICLGFPGATLDSADRGVLQVIDAGLSGLGLPSGRLYRALRGESRVLRPRPELGRIRHRRLLRDLPVPEAEKIGRISNADVIRVARTHFANSVLVLTAPERWLKRRGLEPR